jgi:aspartokinase-like uncharacterized kinase
VTGLIIIKLGGSHAESPLLRPWLDAIAAAGRCVLVPGGGPFADAVRTAQPRMGFDDTAAHDMALMAMAQYGRALCALHTACIAADSDAAIRAALTARRVPVWLPWPMLRDAPGVPPSWDVTSDSLALWLAIHLGAAGVVLVKHDAARGGSARELVASGLVDAAFPHYSARFPGNVSIAGPDDLAGAAEVLASGRLPGLILRAQAA